MREGIVCDERRSIGGKEDIHGGYITWGRWNRQEGWRDEYRRGEYRRKGGL